MVERERIGFRGAAEEGVQGDQRIPVEVQISGGLGAPSETTGGEAGRIIRYNSDEFKPNQDGGLTRVFKGGATRDTDVGKMDYEGFFSPIVLKRRAEYMHKHRQQSDGKFRESDNWQKGIPVDEYMKSMFRHFVDVWMEHRGYDSREGIEEALCALVFNAEGYLYEILEGRR